MIAGEPLLAVLWYTDKLNTQHSVTFVIDSSEDLVAALFIIDYYKILQSVL